MPDIPGLSNDMVPLQEAVTVLEAVGLIVLAAIGWHLSSVSDQSWLIEPVPN